MISYEEALSTVTTCGGGNLLPAEAVALDESVGRILAAGLTATMANQPFDNSAMDGFALRAQDIDHASNDNPVPLGMIGHLPAGGAPAARALMPGECYEIMTGAPVPHGCDAVVPVEKTEKDWRGRIIFRAPASKGDNIRLMGADFKAGDSVLSAGTTIRPEHILTLATLGIGKIRVIRKPNVAILSTGQEVVDDLAQLLKPGQIYNSTGPYLRASLTQMGARLSCLGTVGDDPALYVSRLRDTTKNGQDVIISTGAVSAGAHDFVPAALKELGAKIIFHKVAIRPGKPILFARLPDNGPFFFGLPGNPVSTAVGLRFFVQPLLRAMAGLEVEQPRAAVMGAAYAKKKIDLRFFLRAALRDNELFILQNQQSFMVSPFVQSDVWVSVDKNLSTLNAGDRAGYYT